MWLFIMYYVLALQAFLSEVSINHNTRDFIIYFIPYIIFFQYTAFISYQTIRTNQIAHLWQRNNWYISGDWFLRIIIHISLVVINIQYAQFTLGARYSWIHNLVPNKLH